MSQKGMNRRKFIKRSSAACAAVALLPGSLHVQAEKASAMGSSGGTKSGAKKTSAAQAKPLPEWAGRVRSSDMNGIGPDGKPDPDYNANGTGHSRANFEHDPLKPHQMALTSEEKAILDGKKGEVLAKVMKTVVAHGNAFGATKLVDLGGRPHSSFYMGPPTAAPCLTC